MRFYPARIKAFMNSLFVPFSIVLPILVLYIFDPNSFESTWKGRFPYVFFLWLFFLELALGWERLPKKTFSKSKWVRAPVAVVAMAVPTAYAIGTYMFGLRQEVIEVGSLLGLPPFGYDKAFLTDHWPLSFEYLVFTAFFTASILLTYGVKGLRRFSVSLFFLGAIGASYTTDTFYPFGTLILLQKIVPLTASSAANVLNWMGYKARLFHYELTRQVGNRMIKELINIIWIGGEEPQLVFAINWPCAGVHSLFIYTFVILLFLKEAPFYLQREVVYGAVPKRLRFMVESERLSFLMQRKTTRKAVLAAEALIVNVLRMVPVLTIVVVGAVGTFIVNVLRIASIYIIGINVGPEAAVVFHSYYGELYFIVWILLYLFAIIFGSRILRKLGKIRDRAKRM